MNPLEELRGVVRGIPFTIRRSNQDHRFVLYKNVWVKVLKDRCEAKKRLFIEILQHHKWNEPKTPH